MKLTTTQNIALEALKNGEYTNIVWGNYGEAIQTKLNSGTLQTLKRKGAIKGQVFCGGVIVGFQIS